MNLKENESLTAEEMEKLKGIFSRSIKNLCEEKQITQRELAERLGVTEITMSLWVQGKRVPDVETISKIVDCFGSFTMIGED